MKRRFVVVITPTQGKLVLMVALQERRRHDRRYITPVSALDSIAVDLRHCLASSNQSRRLAGRRLSRQEN